VPCSTIPAVYEPVPELPYIPLRPVLPLERIGAIAEILICSGFPSQLLLILVLRASGMRMMLADGHLSPPFVFLLSLSDAALVVGLVIFCLRAHHESIRLVLFGTGRIVREVLLGIAVLPALFMLVVLVLVTILHFAPNLHNVPHNPLEDMLRTRRDAIIFAGVVMIAGGVREEVQRGFIVHRFRHFLGGAGWGVAIYSVMFGLGHIEQGIDAMIATAILGLVWGLFYLARRSIVAAMVSHAGFNLAQLIKYMAFAVR
jgi:membrane protease YdiL (CAAX protease family)